MNAISTINMARLLSAKETLHREFVREPFNYIVIDDFLNLNVAKNILEEFPVIESDWVDARGLHTQNKWTKPIVDSGFAAKFMEDVNSKEFKDFLTNLTGINGIVSDPNLNGAGYHQTTDGGFLNVHVDFNKNDDDLNLDRRLNLIVYFNQSWSHENGGYLELWDMSRKKRIENIEPSFNRCVIFETNEVSFHGHPTPLKLPAGESRKSLSIYYYTYGRDDIEAVDPHNTRYVNTESWRGLPKLMLNGVRHFFRRVSREQRP